MANEITIKIKGLDELTEQIKRLNDLLSENVPEIEVPAEPKKAEPKKAEPKKAEPKKAEPKKAEVVEEEVVEEEPHTMPETKNINTMRDFLVSACGNDRRNEPLVRKAVESMGVKTFPELSKDKWPELVTKIKEGLKG